MYSSGLIRRATQMKAVFLQCRHHFHVIPIAELLTRMPPDSTDNYDLQLRNSVRDLKHLKENFTYDIVIIYCALDAEDAKTIHPRSIKRDLETAELKCWFTENPGSVPMEQMVIILRNASLVLYCMTDNFVNDAKCCEMFDYAKGVLNKMHMLVVLGNSFDWQKTNIGAMVTDELFIKVNTLARFVQFKFIARVLQVEVENESII